ncbi:MAG TPA: nucleoside monophosphate kinase [Acidimicrobiales bacterium]|nr:nucleoside monophosphate kinase [Acidimicrobiales bacterium]
MPHRPRLAVVGRQGSGKGTQAARLAERLQLTHVSTGDLLRAAIAAQSDLGRRVAATVERGALVDDDVMLELISEQARAGDWARGGVVLDGYPRTVRQAETFLRALPDVGLDLAIELQVPVDDVLARMARRRVCPVCGTVVTVDDPSVAEVPCPLGHGPAVRRDDDLPDAIERRLAIYERETGPLLHWLAARSLLAEIDGTGSPDEVAERVHATVTSRLAAGAPHPK